MYDELCETRRLVAALQARLDDQEARIAEQEARQAEQEKELKASDVRMQFMWKQVTDRGKIDKEIYAYLERENERESRIVELEKGVKACEKRLNFVWREGLKRSEDIDDEIKKRDVRKEMYREFSESKMPRRVEGSYTPYPYAPF